MLTYLTSISFAELLTTLAAWGGLFISLYTAIRALCVRVTVQPLLTALLDGGVRFSSDVRHLGSLSDEDRKTIAETALPSLRIVNKSAFPVYVESVSLGPTARDWWKHSPVRRLAWCKGLRDGKTIDAGGFIKTPFSLQPREAVTLSLFDLNEAWRIDNLLSWKFVHAYVRLSDGHVFGVDCRDLLRFTAALSAEAGTAVSTPCQ